MNKRKVGAMAYPTAQQVREICAAAICDERTVRRAYKEPQRCTQSSHERVKRAALKLGIEPPPGKPRIEKPPGKPGDKEAA